MYTVIETYQGRELSVTKVASIEYVLYYALDMAKVHPTSRFSILTPSGDVLIADLMSLGSEGASWTRDGKVEFDAQA